MGHPGVGYPARSPSPVRAGVAERYCCRGGEGVQGHHVLPSAQGVSAPAEAPVHVDAELLRQHGGGCEPGDHSAVHRRTDGTLTWRRCARPIRRSSSPRPHTSASLRTSYGAFARSTTPPWSSTLRCGNSAVSPLLAISRKRSLKRYARTCLDTRPF